MSTLTSRDLNINRPSTKLHAPPGGKSSISFGYDEPVKSNPVRNKGNQSSISFGAENSGIDSPRRNQPISLANYQDSSNRVAGSAPTSARGSMSSLLSQDQTYEDPVQQRGRSRGSSNMSGGMSDIMNHDESASKSSVRVRQAPGGMIFFSTIATSINFILGRSNLVIG